MQIGTISRSEQPLSPIFPAGLIKEKLIAKPSLKYILVKLHMSSSFTSVLCDIFPPIFFSSFARHRIGHKWLILVGLFTFSLSSRTNRDLLSQNRDELNLRMELCLGPFYLTISDTSPNYNILGCIT